MKQKKDHDLSKPFSWIHTMQNLFNYLNNNIIALNNSKVFAGIIIIVLNISSKFVTITIPKTMESYLKYTFSRDILIFAMAWMGTRDIYVSLCIVTVFIITMDFLFNEDSMFCCLPEQFTNYHVGLLSENSVKASDAEIIKAKEVLDKCLKQNQLYRAKAELEESTNDRKTMLPNMNKIDNKVQSSSKKELSSPDIVVKW
jgi:hypothetical protein